MTSSGIPEIMNVAWDRGDVLRLEVGQPDFATQAHIVQAAHSAALERHTSHTPTTGIPELCAALAEKVRSRNGLSVDPAQVVLGNGGRPAIHAVLVALTEPGDGILLPYPALPNFVMMAAMLGLPAAHYPLTAGNGYIPDIYIPDIADLECLVTPRTRVLLLNSPSNNLGSVIDRERIEQPLAFAVRHDLWVVSDEYYDEITFGDTAVSPAALGGDARVATVFISSNTYAITRPATTRTLELHPPTPARDIHEHRAARSSSLSQQTLGHKALESGHASWWGDCDLSEGRQGKHTPGVRGFRFHDVTLID